MEKMILIPHDKYLEMTEKGVKRIRSTTSKEQRSIASKQTKTQTGGGDRKRKNVLKEVVLGPPGIRKQKWIEL